MWVQEPRDLPGVPAVLIAARTMHVPSGVPRFPMERGIREDDAGTGADLGEGRAVLGYCSPG